ncbi:MAG: hypothetical protein IKZ71_04620, partial [Bacteroidales bacterium]|nr:hypothetical protein [Bacteroidales bacterium]
LSTLNVTYTTSGGEVTMNNYSYAQKNQTFDLRYQDDGSIRVDYSIGAIDLGFTKLSGLAVAALVGVILNAVLPGKDYEFGKNALGDKSVDFEVNRLEQNHD